MRGHLIEVYASRTSAEVADVLDGVAVVLGGRMCVPADTAVLNGGGANVHADATIVASGDTIVDADTTIMSSGSTVDAAYRTIHVADGVVIVPRSVVIMNNATTNVHKHARIASDGT